MAALRGGASAPRSRRTRSPIFTGTGALPSPVDAQIRGLVLDYAKGVIDDEWPAMTENRPSARTQAIFDEMWRTLLDAPSGDGKGS